MSKQSLLLVDGDTRSLRVLEVSLRKAGFSVTPAISVGDALDKLEVNAPDLIISETKFAADLDGFELRRRLRGMPEWAEIPFIFLTAETAIENKIKGLELGVDDYLTKPIYIKEIVTRINILLQKKQRQFLDLKKDGTRFAGRVADMPVVDVIQTIEVSRKSGVIQFTGAGNRQAAIYFRDGKVIDAEAGTLQGEDAVYRLLTWGDGEFEVEFRTVRRREVIGASSQGLLMEGMRRLDEWSRLLEQLPPLSHRFEIDAAELSTRLGDVPDDNNRILRLFDGKRTLLEVIDASDFGDLECLQAISRLYFEGLLIDLDPATRKSGATPIPMSVVSEETPPAHSAPVVKPEPPKAQPPAPEPAKLAPPKGVTMGWDAVADPTEEPAAAAPAPAAAEPAKPAPPKGVTMGWDAVADPTEAPSAAAPEPVVAAAAPEPTRPAPPKGVTMGWDAVADPTEEPVAAAPEPVVAAAATPEPVVAAAAATPPAAPEFPRARRESGVQIDDRDVVAEEEVHPPLAGTYRMSSLRLIDEAVAAAQLIEPSLFEPEELARLGIKPAKPAEPTAAESKPAEAEPAAATVGVTMGWTAVPDPTENPDAVAALAAAEAKAEAEEAKAVAAKVSGSMPAVGAPTNGARGRKKTVPPPIPRAPAKVSPKEIDEAPMLDSNLLTSGEHKIPDDADLDDATPLIDADLLTSGELRIPTPAELAAADAAASAKPLTVTPKGVIHVPLPDEVDGAPPAPEPEDYSGVPTVIAAEEDDGSGDVGGPTNLELPSPRSSASIHRDDRDDAANIRMIGSQGRDRADASGELKPPTSLRIAAEAGTTQRELVTILPRRKTGEVAQLKLDEPETKPGRPSATAKAEASVESTAALRAAETKAIAEREAAKAETSGGKPESKEAADAKPETQVEAKAKPDAKAKPAIEPPTSPPRRVTVEGGVVAPRGPGRAAQVMIVLASILAGATVFSMCRKHKKATTPVVSTQEDAALVVVETPDAMEPAVAMDAEVAVNAVADASIAVHPHLDAAAVVQIPMDAADLVQVRPDAATVVQVRPDAGAVAQVRPDAATVAVAPADAAAAAPADKSKEAKALFDKAHQALEDGDPDTALDLLDQSLKLKRQAKTLLERARALQRLRRIDEAVASIDEAIKMNESYAPAWEQKGMLLWSQQKYTEARPALEMFLQLQPDGAEADKVRAMLEEPK